MMIEIELMTDEMDESNEGRLFSVSSAMESEGEDGAIMTSRMLKS